MHIVFAPNEAKLDLESPNFSLAKLFEYCKLYLALRPGIDFKLVLLNTESRKIDFLLNLTAVESVEERLREVFDLEKAPTSYS